MRVRVWLMIFSKREGHQPIQYGTKRYGIVGNPCRLLNEMFLSQFAPTEKLVSRVGLVVPSRVSPLALRTQTDESGGHGWRPVG